MIRKTVLITLLALCAASAHAGGGSYFYPDLPEKDGTPVTADWELSCDNLNICRAAGYGREGSDNLPVSLLLRRTSAGGLSGFIRILPAEEEGTQLRPNRQDKNTTLIIGGSRFGPVATADGEIALTPPHLAALVESIRQGRFALEVRQGPLRWQLSDAGMKEVLAKMDEIQKLAGTPAAFFQTGTRPVKAGKSAYPVLAGKPLISDKERLIKADSREGRRIAALLRKHARSLKGETGEALRSCAVLAEGKDRDEYGRGQADGFTELPVSRDKKLLLGHCWQGAYNSGMGAWLTDRHYRTVHQAVSASVNSWSGNRLSAYHKGRGLGDCVYGEEWTWDGRRFVQTYAAGSGLCRGFMGGAWQLPSLYIRVKNRSAPADDRFASH